MEAKLRLLGAMKGRNSHEEGGVFGHAHGLEASLQPPTHASLTSNRRRACR